MGSWSCSTSSGYLTATMALYVSRDTRELLGSMMPPSVRAVKSCCFHCGCTLRNSKFFWGSGYQQDRQYCRDQTASNIEMTERFLTEEACQGSWWVLRSRCCSPDSSMWRLAHIEQTRHIRVIILARIWPQESNKLCEPGRGKIIARAIQRSKSKGSVEQLLPICCRSSSFGEAPGCLLNKEHFHRCQFFQRTFPSCAFLATFRARTWKLHIASPQ